MNDAAAERSRYRICPLCEACCGLEVRTRGDRAIGIRGAEDDAFRRGCVCPKAVALKDLHEDPDRLRTPLVRRGGELAPASWDEACAQIERRLMPIVAAHGCDAVALSVGNPAAHETRLPELLRTPSGMVELAPAARVSDLPRELSGFDAPALIVVGRRDVRSNNRWMHDLPTLAKGPQRRTALVHPADAQRAGLADGGRARLAGAGQTVEVTVEASGSMTPGVVSLPHGWGHDARGARLSVAAERPGANLSALLDPALRDPLSGNAVLAGQPVERRALERAEAQARRRGRPAPGRCQAGPGRPPAQQDGAGRRRAVAPRAGRGLRSASPTLPRRAVKALQRVEIGRRSSEGPVSGSDRRRRGSRKPGLGRQSRPRFPPVRLP